MLQKMYLIEIVGKIPRLLGPYSRVEDRRGAYFELRGEGREVYTLDTYTGGGAYVGHHVGEGR